MYNTIKHCKHLQLSRTWGIVWHLYYKTDSWGHCFNKAECGTAVSTFCNIPNWPYCWFFFRFTHFDLRSTKPKVASSSRCPWELWDDETSALSRAETWGLDGSPAQISFRACATKHLSLFLWYKTWHLSAFDLQRSALFHNMSSSWVTLTNRWFSLYIVEEINWEEWLAEIRIWVFHHREMSSAWSWLL